MYPSAFLRKNLWPPVSTGGFLLTLKTTYMKTTMAKGSRLDVSFASPYSVGNMVLEHYGSDVYDKDLFIAIANSDFWCKPTGGLWCSIHGSSDSWAMWCVGNDYKISDRSFKLKFKKGSCVCLINSYMDLLRLPALPPRVGFLPHYFDFELMVSCGIDAIYLTETGQVRTRYTDGCNLYGWDCESVLVLNRDSVTQL